MVFKERIINIKGANDIKLADAVVKTLGWPEGAQYLIQPPYTYRHEREVLAYNKSGIKSNEFWSMNHPEFKITQIGNDKFAIIYDPDLQKELDLLDFQEIEKTLKKGSIRRKINSMISKLRSRAIKVGEYFNGYSP